MLHLYYNNNNNNYYYYNHHYNYNYNYYLLFSFKSPMSLTEKYHDLTESHHHIYIIANATCLHLSPDLSLYESPTAHRIEYLD